MGIIEDKLVILLRDHYGSVADAAPSLGMTKAGLWLNIKQPKKRKNLLKLMPVLHDQTKVGIVDIYNAIVDGHV